MSGETIACAAVSPQHDLHMLSYKQVQSVCYPPLLPWAACRFRRLISVMECVMSWLGLLHTLSIAFRHLPPNSARFGYATLFISAQLSTDAVSTLRKVWVPYKYGCRSNLAFIVQELCESRGGRPRLSVLTSLKPVLNWANVCSRT